MNSRTPPRHLLFEPTPEIFATDAGGGFRFPLLVDGSPGIGTGGYEEARLVVSVWHPSSQSTIDLDRAYLEVQGSFDPNEEHWIKLAEIEPVVSPYDPGGTFDGWVLLPVFAASSAFTLVGGGFQPRSRLQIRAGVYLVS